jgi:predicted dienelactone hydrolase
MVKVREWRKGPTWIYYFLTPLSLVKMPLTNKGPVAPEFRDAKKLLQPIILSHALGLSRSHYMTLCRELASFGFIVFALNHNDRSCELTTGPYVSLTSPDD